MKNKLEYLLVLFICACVHAHAQINLVLNGDFEEKYICPHSVDEVKDAKYWNCIDTSYTDVSDPYFGSHYCSPEYINTCSTDTFSSAPANREFYQYPRSKNGMFNVGMYDNYGDTNSIELYYHRDYLMGHLAHPLIAGQSYCVTFYVVMSNLASFAIDHMGAYLDDGSIDTVSKCGVTHTEYTPQVYATSIIGDSVNWVKIAGSFMANGTERYITIGNFFDTAHTNKIQIQSGHASMYEVDDVSVIASNAQADAGRDTTIYTGQIATIGVDSNGGGMPCYWYVLGGGIAAIDSGGTIEVHPTTTTSYVVIMDLCGTVTYDTVTVNVTPCPAITAAYTDTGSAVRGFTYTGTTALMDSVKWDFGDGHADTALNPVHTYTANGTYHVCVTVYTICGSDSACSDITVSGLGVGAVSRGSMQLWPNPTRGGLTLTVSINGEGMLCTMQGRVVATYKVHSGENNLQLPAGLSAGVYMLQLRDAATGERVVRKVVKE